MFLQMSIIASILILLTLTIRFFFHGKLPKMIFPILWIVVLARLLIPMSFYTEYSIQNIFAQVREQPTLELATVSAITETAPALVIINWTVILSTIWLVGASITASYFIISYIKLRRLLRFAIPIKDNDLITNWKLQNQLSRNVTIMVASEIKTPFATGIVRPKIYLPKQMNWENSVGMEYILAHEFYHIKRFDAVWKLIAMVALCIHWFNPLVWLACVCGNRDLEITCDAWVVKRFGSISKKSYAYTLIGMAEKQQQLTSLSSGFAKTGIEERIKSIMKGSRTSFVGISIATLLVFVFTFSAFATSRDMEVLTESGSNDLLISEVDDVLHAEFANAVIEPPVFDDEVHEEFIELPTFEDVIPEGYDDLFVEENDSDIEFMWVVVDDVGNPSLTMEFEIDVDRDVTIVTRNYGLISEDS